jgi:hypothetical protein
MKRQHKTGPYPGFMHAKREPPKTLELNAQYIGINTKRAVAIQVGWSRSQAVILMQVSLVATVTTFVFASTPPYQAFALMGWGCFAGMVASIMWMVIIRRTNKWVQFDNEALAELELAGAGAPVKVYSSAEFTRVSAGWGARRTLRLVALVVFLFWAGMSLYILNQQYPRLLPDLFEESVALLKLLLLTMEE